MKKKLIIATSALSIMFAGVVSAASIWGTYKGNDIIRLTVGGEPVKVSDVPAISYNDRTMIPIYLLKQAGIDYTWDQKNKTVDITTQQSNSNYSNTTSTVGIDWKGIFKHLKSYNVGALDLGINDSFDSITADYNGTANSMTNEQYNEILKTLAYSGASYFQIYFTDTTSYTYTSSNVKKFYEGKITEEQLNATVTVNIPQQSTSTSGASTSSTIVSKIDGDFNGFNYGNIYILQNGQIWKQTSYDIKVSYKYSPKVTIYKDGSYYYMMVDGIDKQVKVELIK